MAMKAPTATAAATRAPATGATTSEKADAYDLLVNYLRLAREHSRIKATNPGDGSIAFGRGELTLAVQRAQLAAYRLANRILDQEEAAERARREEENRKAEEEAAKAAAAAE
jgi:hypothetical protein